MIEVVTMLSFGCLILVVFTALGYIFGQVVSLIRQSLAKRFEQKALNRLSNFVNYIIPRMEADFPEIVETAKEIKAVINNRGAQPYVFCERMRLMKRYGYLKPSKKTVVNLVPMPEPVDKC